MFARYGIVKVKPGKLDQFVTTFREEMVPPARKQKGFSGITVLGDAETNTVVLISYWASEADMRAVEASAGSIQTQASKIAGLVEGPPVVTHMQVMHQANT